MIFGYTFAQIRKGLVALAGVLTTILTANLLPDTWAHWVSSVAGILTIVGTFAVPNAPIPGRHEAPGL